MGLALDMGMNKKTKSQHIQVNNRALLGTYRGINILSAEIGDKTKQGIHLLNPTEREMDDALDVAARDLFDTIWIHDSKRSFR